MTIFETTMIIAMLIFLCVEVVYLLIHVCNIEADMDWLLCNMSTFCEQLLDDGVVECIGKSQADEELKELKQMVARSRKYTDKVKREAKNAGQRKSRQV